MGLYSKITGLDQLKDGDKIAVPNDTTNEARALLLLRITASSLRKEPDHYHQTGHN